LHELLEDILLVAVNTAHNKNIILINNIREESSVYADSNMVRTILRNLVSNAIKYSYENSEVVIYDSDYQENTLKITVSDSGMGIKAEELSKLFNLTAKSTTLGTFREKGTCLGLALCKEFVEKTEVLYGQNLNIKKGVCFTLHFPKVKKVNLFVCS